MSSKESQRDEICALESIYNEEEIQTHEENGLLGGQFYAYIELPAGFRVVFRDLRKEDSSFEELPLKCLPPISLHFSLPSDYPFHSPPVYRLSCQWLKKNKVMLLCKKLNAIWKENEGMEVLFLWTQFLKEDALKFLKIADVLDVSPRETAFIKHEEFRRATRALHLEEEQKRKNEKSEKRNVNAPSKQSDYAPAACDDAVEYPRSKQRGRPRWGRSDRGRNQRKKCNEVSEFKTENCVPQKTEAMTTSIQSTGTVQGNCSNSGVSVYGSNKRSGNWAQRRYHRGTAGRVHNSYYNRSVRRGNNHWVSVTGSNSGQVVSEDLAKDSQCHKSSSEPGGVLDRRCSDGSKAANVGNASQNCTVDNQEEEAVVTSDGVERAKASESLDVARKQRSKSVQSNAMRDSALARPKTSIVQLLRDYDEARQRVEFSRSIHTCKICFQDKQGSQCTRFDGCGHVFCKSCVAEYFEVRIKDGNVKSICCPEGNCTSEAVPGQVRELVSAELFSHYDAVLLSSLLDTMENILYCPRPACQYPVILEPGENMATCPSCAYAFCIHCKMVYHGIEPCRLRSYERRRLVEEYCNASDERRVQMEQRYGRKQLQTLVDTSLSENWLASNSKKCPSCGAAIEKSDGCNKMVCWKCNTFFCWLCEERLDPESPYLHFSDRSSKCYRLLFYGVPFPDDEDDWWVAPGIFLENNDDDDEDDY
ncbi:E3 ubiquitin-protein ligase RNF14-like isoform X2 [Zootermopsis nevadensis]|uniref:E3 ubiquitin-protein ligase RNF14-like isoform X2 n=1 Tax=Zootermopsis nevadensis TaxID=136037 RepID=UPI000B8E447C|nr:E3 ubiquitin-protein ligase RNF14-like isoform X2 [Zootermopsis nevadensis]